MEVFLDGCIKKAWPDGIDPLLLVLCPTMRSVSHPPFSTLSLSFSHLFVDSSLQCFLDIILGNGQLLMKEMGHSSYEAYFRGEHSNVSFRLEVMPTAETHMVLGEQTAGGFDLSGVERASVRR